MTSRPVTPRPVTSRPGTPRTPPPEAEDQVHAHWLRTCLLFFLGWVFMYADRSILAPVQEEVRLHFDITNAQVGLISSVFFIVYVLMQVPSGILGDRMGRVKLILIGFVIFGISTGLTGLAGLTQVFGLLLLARALSGLGEGLYYGPQYATSGETTPRRYRALGIGIINSGQGVGTALGLVVSGFITFTLGWGWQATFLIFAVPTLLVGFLIYALVPDRKPSAPATTLRQEKDRFASLLCDRRLLAAFAMLFTGVYGFFVMVTWLPTYLTRVWGVQESSAGWVASIVFLVAIPAALVVGNLSDRWGRRRVFVLVLGPASIASIALIAYAPSYPLVIVALVCYGAFGKLALDPVLVAIVADTAPDDLRSSAYGLYNGIGMSAAIVSPYLTGAILDSRFGYDLAFGLSMVLIAIGTLIFARLYHDPLIPSKELT